MQYLTDFVKQIVPYGTENNPRTLQALNTILISLLVISIFVPIRKVLGGSFANITGIYSDFTSFSLYLADILVFLILFFNFRAIRLPKARNLVFLILIFIFLIFSAFMSAGHTTWLSWYFLARFIELLVLYWVIGQISFSLKPILFTFVILGALESGLVLIQFFLQHSLGLSIFRESLLNLNIQGVAKIVSRGTTFIRGYGTLPHPNLLSAFLFSSILISSYLFIRNILSKYRIIFLLLTILLIIGLLITFSRTGIVTAGIFGGIMLLITAVKQSEIRGVIIKYIILILFAGLAFGIMIKPFLLPRVTITDQGVIERQFYNQIGLNIIKHYPITGVGIGTNMLHVQQFSPVKLEPWEIQPVHNYYLLMAVEAGIPIAIIFILFFLWNLKKLWKLFRKQGNVLHLTLLCILTGFAFLMLFDHYFYTLVPTQILLWLMLGLALREIKSEIKSEIKKPVV